MNTQVLIAAQLEDDPLVLMNRQLRPDTRRGSLSRFSDATWDLTPGVFEDHSTMISLNFEVFPEHWRQDVKTYFWHLINDEKIRPLPAGPTGALPSLRTIAFVRPHLLRLITWFESQGIRNLDRVTPKVLDALLGDLSQTDLNYAQKRNILTETRRLWNYRDVVPVSMQLPAAAPWLDERAYDLLGRPPQKRENLTPRISDETLTPLIGWSIQFVENFADDIIGSYRQYLELIKHEYRHRPEASEQLQASDRKQRLRKALAALKKANVGLPGRVLADGTREVGVRGRIARKFTLRALRLGR